MCLIFRSQRVRNFWETMENFLDKNAIKIDFRGGSKGDRLRNLKLKSDHNLDLLNRPFYQTVAIKEVWALF